MAIDFSQSTCLPASVARIVHSRCMLFGSAIYSVDCRVASKLVERLAGRDGALRKVLERPPEALLGGHLFARGDP
jgi:hypothetical protein